jgi:hypothetical protein
MVMVAAVVLLTLAKQEKQTALLVQQAAQEYILQFLAPM